MAYSILISKRATKDIGKLPAQLRTRLQQKLQWFVAQPDPIDFAEALTKPADAQYRFRVGDFRVLFDAEHDTIIILRVQHRREIYRR